MNIIVDFDGSIVFIKIRWNGQKIYDFIIQNEWNMVQTISYYRIKSMESFRMFCLIYELTQIYSFLMAKSVDSLWKDTK